MKTRFSLYFIAFLLVALARPVLAQPTTAYQIMSGEYVMVGGIWGRWTNRLPDSAQSFLEVTTDALRGTASARILGADRTSVALARGTLSSSGISFHHTTTAPNFPINPNPATLDYQINLTNGAVRLDGSIRTQPLYCDIPYAFLHHAVQAVPLPDLYIEPAFSDDLSVSTNTVFLGDLLEVHWQGYNNRTYCFPEIACVERFGPVSGSWQDGVFLFNSSTNLLLGTATFTGSLAVGGSYTNQGSCVIPTNTAPGRYGVEIRIDYRQDNTNGMVVEQNEGNNAGRLSSVLTVLPRLALTGIRRLNDHTVWLQVRGSVPQPVRIQASSSLSGGAWTDLMNTPGFRGVREFQDTAATNKTRFYRVLSP